MYFRCSIPEKHFYPDSYQVVIKKNMLQEDNEIEKLYYTIGDVASMLHVPASLLRFWEKEFPGIIQPHKSGHGRRMYTAENISAIRILYDLIKNQGYTLEGAKKHFRESKKEHKESGGILLSLQKIKKELLDLKHKVNS